MQHHLDVRALLLGGQDPITLVGFCDVGFTPEDDSTFQYGFALFLRPRAGAYGTKSKRSITVAHGRLQAEMKALAEICKEIEADCALLDELNCTQDAPTVVYTDSQSARCRHFNRDVNYVRQCVLTGVVSLAKIPTA